MINLDGYGTTADRDGYIGAAAGLVNLADLPEPVTDRDRLIAAVAGRINQLEQLILSMSGGGTFIVGTEYEDYTWMLDKTINEIKAAKEAGKVVLLYSSGLIGYLNSVDEYDCSCSFTRHNGGVMETLIWEAYDKDAHPRESGSYIDSGTLMVTDVNGTLDHTYQEITANALDGPVVYKSVNLMGDPEYYLLTLCAFDVVSPEGEGDDINLAYVCFSSIIGNTMKCKKFRCEDEGLSYHPVFLEEWINDVSSVS